MVVRDLSAFSPHPQVPFLSIYESNDQKMVLPSVHSSFQTSFLRYSYDVPEQGQPRLICQSKDDVWGL